MSRRTFALLLSGLALALSTTPLPAQQSGSVPPSLLAEMKWRAIGPNRGGRTKSAAGHPSHPYTFYIGVCNGGVWKTTDAGRTWTPIFDDQETGSIGSVVVAPSDPNILYVGSGEGLARPDLSVGDGVYKSTDAGKTWTHLPQLRDAQQVPNIAVDPKNADRVFVAVFGHPYGPNKDRGVYRSTDGGRTFQAVLQKDENIGANDVDIDPTDPNVVYATMWEERQGPWEDGQWRGTGGGIFKSTDGGTTWKQLKTGLPNNGDITQANLAIAPSNTKRLYAAVGSGAGASMYVSNDAGETWTAGSSRGVGRIGGGDLSVVIVDPKNADTIITANTVSYKSTDAGQTWVPFKGAPGGDDYQNAWINPNDPNIILLASDQGAVVTLNGGQSWSSWYNQPTAQLYHVNTDNDFPYRVCSGQQESGSACVSSRGNDGQITFREWHPVNVEEYGYAVPDPKDPNIVFGGKVTRYDRRMAQNANVSPTGGGRGGGPAAPGAPPPARAARTQPLAFSPVDPRILFYGNNVLWKTIDQGLSWKAISPELNRKTWPAPKTIAKYFTQPEGNGAPNGRSGLIYAIAPSYTDVNRIWVGTDDGTIHTTIDGGLTWKDVTPPTLQPWMKIFNMDAGRFDSQTAYAAANTLRIDDMRPHLFRTHDGGKTWTEINTGLENAGPTSTIREDPKKKGLLFAGSERHVWVSFDDGDHWQTLKLNMGSSSVRDLTIKDDDLIAATHGRGFWILDDITPLRQISASTADAPAALFSPAPAWRVRWNTNSDTPLPPDESNLRNPPEGALINYYLKSPASLVTLEILQPDGRLVRRYSSTDPVPTIPEPTTSSLPAYWYRPPQGLSAAAGLHRFSWDVHLQPLGGGGGGAGGGGGGALPIAAVPYNTVASPTTPWANPGTYTVKLTVDGKSYTQSITVKQDPRVKTAPLVMQTIYSETKAMYYGAADAQEAGRQAQGLRDQIAALKATGPVADSLAALDKKLLALAGAPGGAGGGRGGGRGGGGAAGGGRAGGGGRGGGAAAAGAGGGGAATTTPPVVAPPVIVPPVVAAGAPAAPAPAETLASASGALSGVMSSLQGADVQPTVNQMNAIAAAKKTAATVMAQWNTLKSIDLPAVNAKLKAAGLGELTIK
jgi:photosystem II stability/assembly factor-like uncharacterized protein